MTTKEMTPRSRSLLVFYFLSIVMLVSHPSVKLWIGLTTCLSLYYIYQLCRFITNCLLVVEFSFDLQLYNLFVMCQRNKATNFILKTSITEKEDSIDEEVVKRCRHLSSFIFTSLFTLATLTTFTLIVIGQIRGGLLFFTFITYLWYSLILLVSVEWLCRQKYNMSICISSNLFKRISVTVTDNYSNTTHQLHFNVLNEADEEPEGIQTKVVEEDNKNKLLKELETVMDQLRHELDKTRIRLEG